MHVHGRVYVSTNQRPIYEDIYIYIYQKGKDGSRGGKEGKKSLNHVKEGEEKKIVIPAYFAGSLSFQGERASYRTQSK